MAVSQKSRGVRPGVVRSSSLLPQAREGTPPRALSVMQERLERTRTQVRQGFAVAWRSVRKLHE